MRAPGSRGWNSTLTTVSEEHCTQWTKGLIDTNPKCRLFFKIDLQEYYPALICLSADEFCQSFSLGGNFYVDSGSWFRKNMYKLQSNIVNGSYILNSLYRENKNPHFSNLQDSTHHPCIYHVYSYIRWCEADRNEGGERSIREKVERGTNKNTNKCESISSL